MAETIFSKIINKELPADIVYEDDDCLAFKDINPQAPVHILVIPKKPIEQLSHSCDEDQFLLGKLMMVANRVAIEAGYEDSFRLVINNGSGAGQEVFHLHLHVLAGRPMQWPPG